MSVECGICESDLRGGHAEDCPYYTPPIRCKSCGGLVREEWCCEDCGEVHHNHALAQPQPSPSAGEVLRQLSEYTSEPTGLVAMIARSVLGGQDWKTVILLESEWHDVIRSPEAAQLRALLTPQQPTPELETLAEKWEGHARWLADEGDTGERHDAHLECAAELRAALTAPTDAESQ